MDGSIGSKGTCCGLRWGAENREVGERPALSVVVRTTCELGSLCGSSTFSIRVFPNMVEVFLASSGHPCLAEFPKGWPGRSK